MAVDSDTNSRSSLDESVAERLLPPDYREILLRAVTPVSYSSKSELYDLLCKSILIEEGRKSFFLEPSTGKKCLMISVRRMVVAYGSDRCYWRWKSEPQISRFSLVAEMVEVCWTHLIGKIEIRELSPGTLYAGYLVFMLKEDSYGLDGYQLARVSLGAYAATRKVCLEPSRDVAAQHDAYGVPHPRSDGWMELELGEFTVVEVEDEDESVCFSLMELEVLNWKCGLVVEGIEVRPKMV